ncbi:MAG TPA: hypothetical protein VD735_00280 [Candidatus Saccharimonadales bacterium]|nr:hypothetical protein [Candidatus Saccharimonadales bacterium]
MSHPEAPQQFEHDATSQLINPFMAAVGMVPECISASTAAMGHRALINLQEREMGWDDFVSCQLDGVRAERQVRRTIDVHNRLTDEHGLPRIRHENLPTFIPFVFGLSRDRFLSTVEQLSLGKHGARLERTPVPLSHGTAPTAEAYLSDGIADSTGTYEEAYLLTMATTHALRRPAARFVTAAYRDSILFRGLKPPTEHFPDPEATVDDKKVRVAELLHPIVATEISTIGLQGISNYQQDTFAYNITRPF